MTKDQTLWPSYVEKLGSWEDWEVVSEWEEDQESERSWKADEGFLEGESSSMSSAADGVNKMRTGDWPLDLTTWRSLMILIGAFHFALVPLVVEAKRKPIGFHNYHDFSLRNLPIFLRHHNFFWEFIMWVFTKRALWILPQWLGDFFLFFPTDSLTQV